MKPHSAPTSATARSVRTGSRRAGRRPGRATRRDRGSGAEQVLALGADVEQAGLEAKTRRPDRRGSVARSGRGRDSAVLAARATLPERLISAEAAGRGRWSRPASSALVRTMIDRADYQRQDDGNEWHGHQRPRLGGHGSCPAHQSPSQRLGWARVLGGRGVCWASGALSSVIVGHRRRLYLFGRPATRGHQQADLVLVGGPSVALRDELAAIHDHDPVGHLEDLVELGGDEQDGRAGVALLDHLAVDELDAADVEAARRLIQHQQLQVAIELARDDDLLLVSARERARVLTVTNRSGI